MYYGESQDGRAALSVSSETVTRLFGDFKKKELLQARASTLIIKNEAGGPEERVCCYLPVFAFHSSSA